MRLDSFDAFIGSHQSLRSKFKITDDGMVFHARLTSEMSKRAKKSTSLSLNAKKRWDNTCKSNANASDLHMPNEDENANENEDVVKDKIVFNFEELWMKYPKRVGKKDALRHMKASIKTPEQYTSCEQALKNYLSSERVFKGFTMNGSTFFNNWLDWVDYKEEVCQTCKGRGRYTSNTGYEMICSCPKGNSVRMYKQ